MKVLLDTHILLWWLTNNASLTVGARTLIADPANTVFISAVTHWEIWLKKSLGKLELPSNFSQLISAEAFENLPLTAAHTKRVAELPWIHRDPFDRMLIAQAQADGLILLTNDETVSRYGDSVRLI